MSFQQLQEETLGGTPIAPSKKWRGWIGQAVRAAHGRALRESIPRVIDDLERALGRARDEAAAV